MTFIMTIMICSSIMLILMKHPLSMGFILLIQTLLTCLMSSTFLLNYWFSYILFLIMIGGMLVLFIYMTSVASNEKFKFSMKIFYLFMIMMIFLLMIMNYDSMLINPTNLLIIKQTNLNISLSKFINFPFNLILYMMIIYLFITLIAVVKITNIKYGPLRQKN
uniref:NADH-ubiquinone oxidoreductase chain 6 n=1 Tax=Paederus fuscipes TaxID=347427 RepID=A0A344H246_9COLE|nr:NADH dehydrogenase subunit 6 [Paederus fuscipes]